MAEQRRRFAEAVARAVAELGGDRAAGRIGLTRSTWYDTKLGKTLPNATTWPLMLAVLEGLSQERTGVSDWNALYTAACLEAGKSVPAPGGPAAFDAPTLPPEIPPRLFLNGGLATMQSFTLPAVSRLDLIAEALEQADERPLLLVGEGGLGKSVLLGQLAMHLADDRTSGAVILVPCVRVPPSADLLTASSADEALAAAAELPTRSLRSFAKTLQESHGRVHVLVDTLDVVLTEHTVHAITQVLADIAAQARLVLTCRAREYEELVLDPLHRRPRLGSRPGEVLRMPRLSPTEILAWAGGYVRSLPRSSYERQRFIDSLSDAVSAATVREVCSVPLRLALACDLYSEKGKVPADLTITDLYLSYWEQRIARDRKGMRTRQSALQEAAALALAQAILDQSAERLSLGVAGSRLPSGPGLDAMVSEGAILVHDRRYEFFHQTYAEFAIARLTAQESDRDELARLRRRLDDPHSFLWPVARHLVLLPSSDERHSELRAAVPYTTPEGARYQALAALSRQDPDALLDIARSIEDHDPELLQSLLPLLADAPLACAEVALEITVPRLEDIDGDLVSMVARTTGAVLARMDSHLRPHHLMAALELVLSRRPGHGGSHELPHITWVPLPQLLIAGVLANGSDPAAERALLTRYSEIGVSAQVTILRAMLNRHRDRVPVATEIWTSLAEAALKSELPPSVTDEEAVGLLGRFWSDPETRNVQGWTRWPDLLRAKLPNRWAFAQVRLIAELARDPDVRTELLAALLANKPLEQRERWLNSARFVADREPADVAESLMMLPENPRADAVGSAAKLASQSAKALAHPTRAKLIATLARVEPVDPRRVWPTLIRLAGQDGALHRDLLGSFVTLDRARRTDPAAAEMWAGTRDSALRSWFDLAPVEFLQEQREQLRALLPTDSRADRIRAALEGRIALDDEAARNWLTEQVLGGPSPVPATKGISAFRNSVRDRGSGLDADVAHWLAELLATEHPGAAEEIAGILADEVLVPDTAFTAESPSGSGATIDLGMVASSRLERALRSPKNTELPITLVKLLIRMHSLDLVPVERVREILTMVTGPALRIAERVGCRHNETAPGEASAEFARWATVVTRIALSSLPLPEVEDTVRRVLVGWDPRQIGKQVERDIASLLLSVLHHSPDFMDWLTTELWPSAGPGTKRAIAEAVAVHERTRPGHCALTLSRAADCPPDLAARIQDWLRN